MREPEFIDERGNFVVKFYKEIVQNEVEEVGDEEVRNLLIFCKTPRTRKEICDYLGLSSVTYAIQKNIMPLVESGKIKLSITVNKLLKVPHYSKMNMRYFSVRNSNVKFVMKSRWRLKKY